MHKRNANIPFPGWDALEAERRELEPKIWLIVKDANGQVVRRVSGPTKKGMHRVAWDLRYPAPDAVDLERRAGPFDEEPEGLLAAPGTYTVSLAQQVNGTTTMLAEPQSFEVVPLRKGALESADLQAAVSFYREYERAYRANSAFGLTLKNAITKVKGMQQALERSQTTPGVLDDRLYTLRTQLLDLQKEYAGNQARQEPGEKVPPTVGDWLFAINRGITRSTYGPTENHRKNLNLVNSKLGDFATRLTQLQSEMGTLAQDLVKAGAPWVEGEALPAATEN